MNRAPLRLLLMALLSLLLLLGGCSDFDEMKSSKLFNQAERLLAAGEEARAEELLTELLGKYPRTRVAQPAERRLQQLRHRRELQERRLFAGVLDSYRQVFTGYHSVYAAYPSSIEEFDGSDYFFDSDYLAGITTTGFHAYLWLTGDERGFRVWCVSDQKARGYAVDGASQELVPIDRRQTLAELERRFRVSTRKGNLFILAPRS